MSTENTESYTPEELAYLASKGYKAPATPPVTPTPGDTPPEPAPDPQTDPEAFTDAETNYINSKKPKK